MKTFSFVLKLVTAIAAVAGAIYAIATYGDQIVAWAKSMMAKCPCTPDACEAAAEQPAEEAPAAEENAPAEEPAEAAPVEEAPAEETPAEEAPVEAPVDEDAPVADESEFVD